MFSEPGASNGSPSGAGERLPVAVIGAGPIGLVAAAHLVEKGATPLVLEAGDTVGASIRNWAHVRVFSPWKYLVDPISSALLREEGWELPDPDALPTGGDFVTGFLEPLAALPRLAPHIRLGQRVLAVSRVGFDKLKTIGRDEAPFELVARDSEGRERRYLARAVIDASGTYTMPNPLGAGGLMVEGEQELAVHLHYGIPDVLGRDRRRYAGRRTLVVGSGHSAFNALLDLAELARSEAGTEVVWAIRRREIGRLFGGGENDALPARGGLGLRLRRLVESGAVRLVTGFRTTRLVRAERGILAEADDATIGPVDELVVTTGFRPDVEMLRELRLRLDPALECPDALAPLIDPNVHSCGTVYPHGAEELRHPERDFYVVGMKSYGRAPTFLLLTGYEQVRSVVCALTGDWEAARAVELVLPETGVCSSDLAGDACCGSGEAVEAVATGGARGASAPGSLPLLATGSRGGCCG